MPDPHLAICGATDVGAKRADNQDTFVIADLRSGDLSNPCSRTVYDPLKYASLPGNVLARGAIVQGSDLRPPLGIEVKIQGKEILAIRME